MRFGMAEREALPRYPIRGIFVPCCASTTETAAKRTNMSGKELMNLLIVRQAYAGSANSYCLILDGA